MTIPAPQIGQIQPGPGVRGKKNKKQTEECLMRSRLSVMARPAGRLRRTMAGLAVMVMLCGAQAARGGFLPLPANGSQVNDDLVSGIDPNRDAGVSDVTGGAVT